MQNDIVTQLRRECQCTDDCRAVNDPCISMRGADEIERLRSMCEEFAQSGKEFGTKYGSDVVAYRINEKKFRKACEKYKGGAW